MQAPAGTLAKVRLWPPPAGDDPLGSAFLNTCAPGEIFFPLTDIMNVAIIPLAPQFGVRDLRRVGKTADWPGFAARFERYGRRLEERAPGGKSVLVSRTPGAEVVDWLPEPATLKVDEGGAAPRHFEGVERWAFRVTFDPGTGMLRSATATSDDIDMAVQIPGASPAAAPHVSITRRVSISPLVNSR
jgi:hypothetical protein